MCQTTEKAIKLFEFESNTDFVFFLDCIVHFIEDFVNSLFLLVTMFGNIVPVAAVGQTQVLPGTILQTQGNVLPNATLGNSDLVIIQDTTTPTNQAELINQLQNHITENQQILIITDDQGQDQCNNQNLT